MRAPAASRGLTLVELLAAVTIFLALAGMVLQVMGGGLGLWATGERDRDAAEQGTVILERITRELRHLVSTDLGEGEPRVKLYCDFLEQDLDRDGAAEYRAQRLLFVRSLYEERTHPVLREAGKESGEGVAFTGQRAADFAEQGAFQGEFLRATEGLVEVAYLPLADGHPEDRRAHAGRTVLWRGLRSPIGGEDSLFASVAARDGGLEDAVLEPLAENVLYLGFEFITGAMEDLEAAPDQGGPLRTWDSTRGLLPAGYSDDGFALARGPQSLEDPEDDVFPRAIRITLVTEAPPGENYEAELLEDLDAQRDTARVAVRGTRFLAQLGAGRHLLRLGHEWLEISEAGKREIFITRRGLRGTVPANHAAGTKILAGRTFRETVLVPAYREDLNRAPRKPGELP